MYLIQCALIENTNGTRDLYAWGNGYGQIGDSSTSTRTTPNKFHLTLVHMVELLRSGQLVDSMDNYLFNHRDVYMLLVIMVMDN